MMTRLDARVKSRELRERAGRIVDGLRAQTGCVMDSNHLRIMTDASR